MLDAEPALEEARIGIALSLLGIGKVAEGQGILLEMAAGDLSSGPAATAAAMLAALYRSMGDTEEMRALLERLAAADPSDPRRLLPLVDVYVDEDDFDKAEETVRKAIELDPDYAPAYRALGDVLFNRDDLPGALAAAEQCVRLDPRYAPGWAFLGWLILGQHECQRAADALQKATRLNPEDAESYGWLALALAELGRKRQAQTAARRAVDLSEGDPDVYEAAAQAYVRLEMWDEARTLFEAILAEDPEDVQSLMALGAIANFQGDRETVEHAHRVLRKVDRAAADELARITGLKETKAPARGRAARASKGSGTGTIYQLKVTLKGIRPPVWRRLLVAGDTSLATLHEILQVAFEWTDSHLHAFSTLRGQFSDPRAGVEGAGNERRVTLAEVAPGEGGKILYEYDFGDSWEHEIVVEKVLPPQEGQPYPQVVTGKRSAPPEDVGGVWGYGNLLEAIRDPKHPEREEMLDWVGEDFDPEAFDASAINEVLRGLG